MNDETRKYLAETFKPLDVSTKNFKPTGGAPHVDPTKPPPFPIGGSAGEKPKGDKSDSGKGK